MRGIARMLGITANRVREARKAEGLARHRPTRAPDELLRQQYEAGYHDARITRNTGVTDRTVRAWRERNGLAPNEYIRGAPPSAIWWDQEEAKRLYDSGMTDRNIARRVDVGTSTVCNWRVSQGLVPARRCVLDERSLDSIREHYEKGELDKNIASAMGIT